VTGAEQSRPQLPSDAGVDEIERDIERTRQELGETVSALSDKLDVKGRVQDKATEKVQATKDAAAARKVPLAAAVAAVVIGLVIWRRKKRGK
jgi:type VI protein secretion system component VasF